MSTPDLMGPPGRPDVAGLSREMVRGCLRGGRPCRRPCPGYRRWRLSAAGWGTGSAGSDQNLHDPAEHDGEQQRPEQPGRRCLVAPQQDDGAEHAEATRSQRALAATHRPAPPTGPSASLAPAVCRPPEMVVRTAVPEVLDPVYQPATTRITPSQRNTCQPRSR
jgi:hypothetical protein